VKAKIIEEAAYSRLDDDPLGRGRGQVRQDHGSPRHQVPLELLEKGKVEALVVSKRDPTLKTQYIKPLELWAQIRDRSGNFLTSGPVQRVTRTVLSAIVRPSWPACRGPPEDPGAPELHPPGRGSKSR
jgi:hypothetical protein